ncbi:KH domain-containing, RNA-binding, signal transduction-associated protein 3-like [Microplitis mediator]|uniref:KH domain-containing, RNA-binding, signal transduction-associated protein 3-like n=1 Tax=Microplitis mediator TaxID=375433 RepID=UPI002553B752|nr:KH domain-containing, RNA-binding, signal transduction-associated protein 3-like [Microplitis mediator]
MTERSSNGDYKYDVEEDGGGDGDSNGGDDHQRMPLEKDRSERADKVGEYMKELLAEKLALDSQKCPNALRLLDQEIQKTQAIGKPMRDLKYVDIYREKPIRVSVKVLVPIREHPKFNFVGKLLGPKGNSMKRLQEETMCKMAVLGRGSMKDRQKEEEFRQSLDPKYAHLCDDLHVEITAVAPPAEAHARIAYALAEVRKYLIPDNNDIIRQEQMREMELTMSESGVVSDEHRSSVKASSSMRSPTSRPVTTSSTSVRSARPPSSRPVMPPPPPHSSRTSASRSSASKAKVFSILDRARAAMDQSYGSAPPPPSSRASHPEYEYHGSSSSSTRYTDRHYSPSASDDIYTPTSYTTYEYSDVPSTHSSEYYETSDYPEDSSGRAWKTYKTSSSSGSASRYRTTPYARPK